MIASAVGGVLLRSGAFVFSGWSGGWLFVIAFVSNRLADDARFNTELAWLLAAGFLLLAATTTLVGVVLSRTLSWCLARLSGWAAAIVLLFKPDGGEWFALALGTLIAAALFAAFVMQRRYGSAVIGCLILLTVWPAGLYRIFESALGVATGLIAAGAVLITVMVLLSRRKPRSVIAKPNDTL